MENILSGINNTIFKLFNSWISWLYITHLFLWFWLVLTFPANNIFMSAIGAIVVYCIGLIMTLCKVKYCFTPYPQSVHWAELLIKRTIWGVCFFLFTLVMIGLYFYIITRMGFYKMVIDFNYIFVVQIAIFLFTCTLSGFMGQYIYKNLILQSLITEANINAYEIYNGTTRIVRN